MNNTEIIQASGNLEIIKVYPNGSEEVVFSDHNVITSGLGVNLAIVFAGSGSNSIEDHQIRWFQLGSGAPTPGYGSEVYKLVAPFGNDYGVGINIDSHQLGAPNGDSEAGTHYFAWIPHTSVRKTSPTSVTYILTLGILACNGLDLKEIGLFVNNPYVKFISPLVRSVLGAYRQFDVIKKTNDFSLVFRWTLSF